MYDVPRDVIQQFRGLGAVRASIAVFDEGRGREYADSNLVYFWDAQGREVGYWNRPCRAVQLFAPNHRTWSPENLAIQVYQDIPPEIPSGSDRPEEAPAPV